MAINLPDPMDRFYTDDYKTLIRSNKEYLISMSVKVPVTDLAFLNAHQYHFYRVLLELFGIPHHMHWTIAFLNGIEKPNQNVMDAREVLIIEQPVINKMIQRLNTKR